MRRALVVVHDPSVGEVSRRVIDLAGGSGVAEIGVVEFPSVDIGPDEEFVGVSADTFFHVVHLVPDSAPPVEDDRARVQAVWESLLDRIRAVHHHLVVRHPALAGVVGHWVVTTLGPTMDAVELETLGKLEGTGVDVPIRSVISVSPSRGSVALTDAMRRQAMGDVAYSLIRSTLGVALMDARQGAVHAGVSSVVYQPSRSLESLIGALRDPVDRLLGPCDPTSSPATAGSGRVRALLAVADDGMPGVVTGLKGGSPSVELTLRTEFARIENEVASFDAGAWFGLLSYELDRMTILSGLADGAPSVLAGVLDQIERARLAASEHLEQRLRSAAADFMDNATSLAAVEAWCDGVETELVERHAKVQALPMNSIDVHMTVAEQGERLRKAAQWLPAGNSLLPRALSIVAMSLIGAYAFAFVPRLLAGLFDVRLPFIGDELETNSQLWARITAGAVGLLIGAGWLNKWRRAVRWRRRWLETARLLVQARVEEMVREQGLLLLGHLISVVGTAERPGSLRGWLVAARADLESARDVITSPGGTSTMAEMSPYSLVLPTMQDMERFRDVVPLTEQEAIRTLFRNRLEMAFRQSRTSAEFADPTSFLPSVTSLPTSLLAYYDQHGEYVSLSRQVLDSDLLPVSDAGAPGAANVMRCIVGSASVLEKLAVGGWRQPPPVQRICPDPNFVCSVWFRRLVPEVTP